MSGGITRRDLLAREPPTVPYPPALAGLRGQHAGSFEAAHAMAFDQRRYRVGGLPVSEDYDCTVVGAGISGLAAAWYYRRRFGADTRILVLDNHDDFGGHARRNEFMAGDPTDWVADDIPRERRNGRAIAPFVDDFPLPLAARRQLQELFSSKRVTLDRLADDTAPGLPLSHVLRRVPAAGLGPARRRDRLFRRPDARFLRTAAEPRPGARCRPVRLSRLLRPPAAEARGGER